MPRNVAPRVGCPEVQLGQNQEEYYEVAAAVVTYADGSKSVLTRWRLSVKEQQQIADGADLYLTVYTFGEPMQPVNLEVGHPEWATE